MSKSIYVAAVISDTDILVHMVKGGVFEAEFVQSILDGVYIPPKVVEELSKNHAAVYNKLRPLLDTGEWLRRTKAEWAH
ncbi:hypothetical protein [Effusibacillus pohliae]|uniref:hypothetical protein n=1 Tax=Effusibacillus pohliae TaxID=232270 RepID=UPI0003606BB4|nr:hypothetical protein [Effusibacillus pohliae]